VSVDGACVAFADVIRDGHNPNACEGPSPGSVPGRQADQIDAIRLDQRLNEGGRIAEHSLAAIVGRAGALRCRAYRRVWALIVSKPDSYPDMHKCDSLGRGLWLLAACVYSFFQLDICVAWPEASANDP